MIIKQFGLPRTCTNVTETIVRSNFKCVFLNNFPDWKHGENNLKERSIHAETKSGQRIDTDDLRFLVCTKHPHDWLWSLYNFEQTKQRKGTRIENFLLDEAWHYTGRQGGWDRPEKNAIEVFNLLTKQWLTKFKEHTFQVKFEDIQNPSDQIKIIKQIEKFFELNRKSDELVVIENRINPACKQVENKFQARVIGFTKSQLNLINERLDKEIVNLAGYEI